MIIFPAIDIKSGKCIRLKQGKFHQVTVYSDYPAEVAQRWEASGAEYLHLVDLDGAVEGRTKNIDSIRSILNKVTIPVQLGGGIRNQETIKSLLDLGISRVILGTAALKDEGFVREMIERYQERILVSIDAFEGRVATDGWVKVSDRTSEDLIRRLEDIGLETLVYTDISKDGMMEGPNQEAYLKIKTATNMKVIASGGIRCVEDIQRLETMGIDGCIIGKALYSNALDLKDVLRMKTK